MADPKAGDATNLLVRLARRGPRCMRHLRAMLWVLPADRSLVIERFAGRCASGGCDAPAQFMVSFIEPPQFPEPERDEYIDPPEYIEPGSLLK